MLSLSFISHLPNHSYQTLNFRESIPKRPLLVSRLQSNPAHSKSAAIHHHYARRHRHCHFHHHCTSVHRIQRSAVTAADRLCPSFTTHNHQQSVVICSPHRAPKTTRKSRTRTKRVHDTNIFTVSFQVCRETRGALARPRSIAKHTTHW